MERFWERAGGQRKGRGVKETKMIKSAIKKAKQSEDRD